MPRLYAQRHDFFKIRTNVLVKIFAFYPFRLCQVEYFKYILFCVLNIYPNIFIYKNNLLFVLSSQFQSTLDTVHYWDHI